MAIATWNKEKMGNFLPFIIGYEFRRAIGVSRGF